MTTKYVEFIDNNRRLFCEQTIAVAAGTVLLIAAAKQVVAAELPLMNEGDSTAAMMGYKHDTTKVDAKRYPKHSSSQTCANCKFYKPASSAAYGPCQLFPSKAVSAKGWCKVWAANA